LRRSDPIITILHALTNKEGNEKALGHADKQEEATILDTAIKEYTNYGKIKYTSVACMNACEGLIDYILENDSDLLALLRRDRSRLESIFHKSIIKYFLRNSDNPLLILQKNHH
jgi:nucleotide-binding universal stress UspA family protein